MLAVLMLNRMRSRRQQVLHKQKLKTRKMGRTEPVLEYCRTCLGSQELVSIFYNRETSGKRTEDLKLITGLEIKMNDGLSQKICTTCIESVNQALQFRLKCVKNDTKLQRLLKKGLGITEYCLERNQPDSYIAGALTDECNVNNDDNGLSLIGDFRSDHDYLEIDAEPEVEQQNRPVRRKSVDEPGKVYKCHICGKEYNRRSSYRVHVNGHTNFCVCEECGKRCLSRTMLLEHQRAKHGLPRIHVCQHCDYSSATKAGLLTHSRRHTGERPYVCEHCAAAFHSRAGLLQHLPIHLEESNFECNICHKREKSKRLLQHHAHKVHRKRRKLSDAPTECREDPTQQVQTPAVNGAYDTEEFETQVILDIK